MNELSSPGRAILSEWGVSQFHGLSTSEGPARSGLKNTGPGRAPGRQVLPPPLVLFTFLTVKAPSLQPPKPTLSPSPTSPLNTLIAPDDWRSPFLRLLSTTQPKALLQRFSPHPCTAQSPGELFFKIPVPGPTFEVWLPFGSAVRSSVLF